MTGAELAGEDADLLLPRTCCLCASNARGSSNPPKLRARSKMTMWKPGNQGTRAVQGVLPVPGVLPAPGPMCSSGRGALPRSGWRVVMVTNDSYSPKEARFQLNREENAGKKKRIIFQKTLMRRELYVLVCNGSAGRTGSVYNQLHVQLCPRRIQTSECPLWLPWHHPELQRDSAGSEASSLCNGTMGKPELRRPTSDSLVKGRLQQCCGRRIMPMGWRQSFPHPACPLLQPPGLGGIPPVCHCLS